MNGHSLSDPECEYAVEYPFVARFKSGKIVAAWIPRYGLHRWLMARMK